MPWENNIHTWRSVDDSNGRLKKALRSLLATLHELDVNVCGVFMFLFNIFSEIYNIELFKVTLFSFSTKSMNACRMSSTGSLCFVKYRELRAKGVAVVQFSEQLNSVFQ